MQRSYWLRSREERSREDRPLVAVTVPSAFLLSEVCQIEGDTILIADCADYDAYKALPPVLKWEEKDYALSGWNSDSHRAYWKINNRVAYTR